jgi:type IV fimbrial biogenesis protein FimT
MTRSSRGFSLLELMIAITLLGILLGIAIPTFREITRNNSVTGAQNDLVTALNLARSEALRRNRRVTVCSSTDGETCGDESSWNEGWIAFTDRTTPGTVDGDDEVLQIWQPRNANLVFTTEDGFVQYAATGMSAAPLTVGIHWTGCTGAHMRRVTVLITGAVTGGLVDCP